MVWLKNVRERLRASFKVKKNNFVAGHRGMVGSAVLDNLKSKGYNNIVARLEAK